MTGAEDDRNELLRDLQRGAEAMGALAKEQEPFVAAVKANRLGKVEPFQALVDHLGLSDRCEVICGWLSSKECVRVCLLLCGRPAARAAGP